MSFLDLVTPFPVKHWPKHENEISNWLKVAKIIYNTEDIDLILQYLQLELSTKNRPMIIRRMYSRYSYLRNSTEYDEIIRSFPKGEPSHALLAILRSWDYTIAHLDNLKTGEDDEIMSLMRCEWQSTRRPYLLKRLFTRFQSRRRRQELQEMQAWSLKKQQNSICGTA